MRKGSVPGLLYKLDCRASPRLVHAVRWGDRFGANGSQSSEAQLRRCAQSGTAHGGCVVEQSVCGAVHRISSSICCGDISNTASRAPAGGGRRQLLLTGPACGCADEQVPGRGDAGGGAAAGRRRGGPGAHLAPPHAADAPVLHLLRRLLGSRRLRAHHPGCGKRNASEHII